MSVLFFDVAMACAIRAAASAIVRPAGRPIRLRMNTRTPKACHVTAWGEHGVRNPR